MRFTAVMQSRLTRLTNLHLRFNGRLLFALARSVVSLQCQTKTEPVIKVENQAWGPSVNALWEAYYFFVISQGAPNF